MEFKKICELASANGITEIELYTRENNNLSISFFDLEVDGRSQNHSKGYCLRGVYNNQIATVYLENDSEEAFKSAINKLKDSASNIEKNDAFYIYGGDEEYQELEEEKIDFDRYDITYKLNFLKELSLKLQKSTELFFHSQAEYEESVTTITIENSNGLNLKRFYKSAYVVAALVCKKDNDVKNNYDFKAIKSFKDLDIDEFVNELKNDTVNQFGATSLPSKGYKVVLKNSVVCDLISVYKTIFLGKSVKEHTSFLEGKLNEKVFGDNVNLYDDPFLKEANIKLNFDDEGVATKRTTLIEKGVLKTYLHNLSTADYFKTKSTGNGFKASVASGVSVDTTNLVLEKGTTSFDDLLKEVNDGVLITSITGLHAGVNQISGDFNVQCSGYKIENGKKGQAVTLIILSGKFQEVFNNIKTIASDSYYSLDGVFAPSIYIENMNISGN